MVHAKRASHRALPMLTAGAVKRHAFVRQALLAFSLGFIVWPSLADDNCDVPVQKWQSREAVHQMAAAQGWHVQRLKIDDGCYEIRGTDALGQTFKAKIDPQTLAIVKMKRKDRDHDQQHTRDPNQK